MSAEGGASVVRLPIDLSNVGPNGVPQWVIDNFGAAFQAAEQYGVKLIFEPCDVPPDLSPNGDKFQEPNTIAGIEALAQRFGDLVRTVHTEFPQYSDLVDSWEVGNEPNLTYQFSPGYDTLDFSDHRFYSVSVENAQFYAQYLAVTAKEIAAVENSLGIDINVIGAGITASITDTNGPGLIFQYECPLSGSIILGIGVEFGAHSGPDLEGHVPSVPKDPGLP